MDGLKVSIACLLFKLTIGPSPVLTNSPTACPDCHPGFFLVKNCSISGGHLEGIQCRQCTTCSAAQEVVHPCSKFTDSVCRNRTTPTEVEPTAPPPDMPIILTGMCVSVFVILLLVLFLVFVSRRNQRSNQNKGVYLPPEGATGNPPEFLWKPAAFA